MLTVLPLEQVAWQKDWVDGGGSFDALAWQAGAPADAPTKKGMLWAWTAAPSSRPSTAASPIGFMETVSFLLDSLKRLRFLYMTKLNEFQDEAVILLSSQLVDGRGPPPGLA
jgi:hypothetical protein